MPRIGSPWRGARPTSEQREGDRHPGPADDLGMGVAGGAVTARHHPHHDH